MLSLFCTSTQWLQHHLGISLLQAAQLACAGSLQGTSTTASPSADTVGAVTLHHLPVLCNRHMMGEKSSSGY